MKSFDFSGLEARQRPCLIGHEAPNESTVGTVGELYMDTGTGKVYKCVGESEGSYTWEVVGGTQPDYNQNDSTQPDYIKNRPFYAKDEVVLDKSNVNVPYSFASFTLSKSLSEFDPGSSVIVEIMGDATIGNSRVETVLNENCQIARISTSDNKWSLWGSDVGIDMTCDADPDAHTISVVVTISGIEKKLDSKFLDIDSISNEVLKGVGVKYIKSDYGPMIMTEELMDIGQLTTGAYVLHGTFRTSANQEINTFYSPKFCQINKVGNKTILFYAKLTGAYPVLCTDTYVNGQCTSANETKFEDLGRVVTANSSDIETSFDYLFQDRLGRYEFGSITLYDENFNLYTVKVGTDGNLKATRV